MKKRNRSAVNGKFVKEKYAFEHPESTVRETVKKTKKCNCRKAKKGIKK